jgi:hypothetical protein
VLVVNPPPSAWVDVIVVAGSRNRSSFAVLFCRRGCARYSYVDLRTIGGVNTPSKVATELFEAALAWLRRHGDPIDACLETFEWERGVPQRLSNALVRITTAVQE